MKITYTGPHDQVEVPDFGIVAKRGEKVEVTKDAVGALCGGDWAPADADAKREWKKAQTELADAKPEHSDGIPADDETDETDETDGEDGDADSDDQADEAADTEGDPA